MKSSFIVLVSLILSVTAQPHRQHQRFHEKRDVVWVTDWEVVTETVEVTATVWVDAHGNPTETQAETTTLTPSADAGQFFEPASSQSPTTSTSFSQALTSSSIAIDVPPTSLPQIASSSTSSVYIAPQIPTSSSSDASPPALTTSSVFVAPSSAAPVELDFTSTPVAAYVPPTSTQVASVAPVETSAAPAAPAASATTSASSSSSDAGTCTSGSPCEGDITYYQAGLGACGTTTDGDTEMVIALPFALMGTQSNGNPYCGKTVTITSGGKTITATVVDKCMGCTGKSIDLSNAAFLGLGYDLSVGRTTAEWYFN